MIYNFTQHKCTREQIKDDIIEVPNHSYVQKLLTFESIPSKEEVYDRAKILADYAQSISASKVMLGGALYLMGPLTEELKKRNINVCFSFTKRESMETIDQDGNVIKTLKFRHLGIVEI